MFTAVQMLAHVEDIDPSVHRDRLDEQLEAPLGEEAAEMAALVQYLTSGD